MAFLNHELMDGPSKFADPFILPSTSSFPKDIKSSLDLCLYLYRMNSLYGAIANRVVSYFMTELEFTTAGNKEDRDALSNVLKKTLKIFSVMQRGGKEWATYGNGFLICVEPFDRWLIDDRDGRYDAISLSSIPHKYVSYDWQNMTYEIPDIRMVKGVPTDKRPGLGELPKVKLKFRDKPSAEVSRISLIFLDPRYIELDKAHHSNSIEYIYSIPPDMESRIKGGVMHEINNTPQSLLEAVKENKDFRFHDGEVFHFKGPSQTGISDSGWACPEVLLHYDALYQLQIYRKADFATAQDRLQPFRLFTPNPGDANTGGTELMNLARWRSAVVKMIAAHRKDPTTIHSMPQAVNYQECGGTGQPMVLHETIEAHLDALFDSMGMPRDLFRGAMDVAQLPNAVRMFEKSYEWMRQEFDSMLKFIASTVQRAMDKPELEVSLKRPSMAYDAEFLNIRMQLATNREVPRADVFPDIGVVDPVDAAARAIQEDQDIQRKAQEMGIKFDKEKNQGSMADITLMAAEQAAQGGGGGAPPPGGAPAPGGGGGGLDYSVDAKADPLQIQQRAQEIAAQWLQMHQQQPNSHRKEMQNCEAVNPTLYAAAKEAMSKMRSQGESQGRAQAGAPPPDQGGGGPPPAQ